MDSDHGSSEPWSPAGAGRRRLLSILEHAAHLLPAQGPISVFVHHNTLHAFEDQPFEAAVVAAGRLFGCEPFLTEERYRAEIDRGRILEHDIRDVLERDLGAQARERVGPWSTRFEIRLAVLRKGIPARAGSELDWMLAETGALEHLRSDLDPEPRRLLLQRMRTTLGRDVPIRRLERILARELWASCIAAVEAMPPSAAVREPSAKTLPRHRDLVLAVTGEDTDDLVHPVLIRMCGAFLDQGVAYWPMPGRDLGFFQAILALYAQPGGPPDPWLARFRDLASRAQRTGLSEVETVEESLEALGVGQDQWEPFLTATLLALRGWAGMVRQMEIRPDRVPVHPPKVSLLGFLAVRLLLERAALEETARRSLAYSGPLTELRQALQSRLPAPDPPSVPERAFLLFNLAQLLGRGPAEIRRLSPSSTAALLRELAAFPSDDRRKLLHQAYERRHASEVLDAIGVHARSVEERKGTPAFQAIFCIDDREESLRRHLEEADPGVATFGIAGFFGVAMYYRGAGDAHSRPLCPVAIRPVNEVVEIVDPERRAEAELRARSRRFFGRLLRGITISSRSFARGTILTAVLGSLAAIPLIVRVLLPRVAGRVRKHTRRLIAPPRDTSLAVTRDADRPPSLGQHAGFSKQEMAAIVRTQLEDIGLTRDFAPLVLLVGHGSSSLNNPHESAYDCGACGGGAGGPSARAFTLMANDPEVRALLAESGFVIPPSTRFAGAFHNTCDDTIRYFEAEDVPEDVRGLFDRAASALSEACQRNAHERCRRFESAPPWINEAMAMAHVERRSHDLAQPRPECGHATNAVAIVGRRSRTRGLFLDRRAFLVSYDPSQDDEAGSILGRLLAAVAPVGAGISLEYYFSYVDSQGYGCGSKLPHNLTGLIGVMDGFQSDLRTGLPWQMVEIHEPVRLLMILETRPEVLLRAAARNPGFGKLVRNGWVRLALLDPDTDEIRVLSNGELRRYEPESDDLAVVRSSMEWYRGRRAHLPCARIVPDTEARA